MPNPLPPKTTLAALVHPGLVAIRRLWLPFLLIQLCGLALVLSYFRSPALQAMCDHLASIKRTGGYAFAALAMGVASGFVPEIFKLITGIDRTLTRQRFRNAAFNFATFAVIGVGCDAFYRLLAYLLGDSNAVHIVVMKVLADQFAFSPLFGTTMIAAAYTLREHRYRLGATVRSFGVAWYLSRALPVLIPSWCYWLPMTCLMYSLPASLTFAFNVLAGAASAMLLVAVAERKTARSDLSSAQAGPSISTPAVPLQSGFTRIDAVD